jgi:hypothetical protein
VRPREAQEHRGDADGVDDDEQGQERPEGELAHVARSSWTTSLTPDDGPGLPPSALAESSQAVKPESRLPAEVLAAIRGDWSIAIRTGSKPHRFIRVWAVVVGGRVFARSWSLKPRSWYRTLLVEPHGVVRVGRVTIPFRAARARGEELRAAVDRAYLRKYARPSEVRYARDLCGPRSRATTTELVLNAEGRAAAPRRRSRA